MQKVLFLSLVLIYFSLGFSQYEDDPQLKAYSEIIFSDPAKAEEIAKKAVANSDPKEKIHWVYQNKLAETAYYMDKYDEAKAILKRTIEVCIERNYEDVLAEAYFIMGDLHIYTGEYATAIDYLSKALELYKKINSKTGIADTYNSFGIIHMDQENFQKAEENFKNALNHGDSITHADSYTYLGRLYLKMGAFEDAFEYASKSIKLAEKNNDTYLMSMSSDVFGGYFIFKKEYDKAIEYLEKALKLKIELEDSQGQALTLNRLASAYLEKGESNAAFRLYLKSFKLSEEIGVKEEIKDASKALARHYAKKLDYDSAYYYQSFYINVVESLSSERAAKKMAEMEAAAQKKEQEAEVARAEMKEEQSRLKAEQEKRNSYYSYGGLALSLIFGIFIFNRFRVSQKQKKIIEVQKKQSDELRNLAEQQKELVEEKNKEILDSINYAKRIQTAILPPDKLIQQHLPNSFVLYKPKDIVAGDFYWMEVSKDKSKSKSSEQEQELILIAAADCTGHGVPGAMVSVVCNNGLNRSVREFGLTDPGKILDKTREIVIKEFEKSEEEVKDGMDIAIVSIEQQQEGGSALAQHSCSKLKYSGAHNPLWIIRKGSDDIEEIKANKQPIGKYAEPEPFTTHEIELNSGDLIYVFSDGYADQFGGDKGKKMKSSNFKKYLLEIKDHDIAEQKRLLDQQFEKWRGEFEQLDDVCVIGVKV
ncbi:MAG: tetratricopeptide repeat protein [Crocinitomicaceae bacterium]|nr:tetratricopeptide repeat protein [Crocinitomicaceae bacterium]